jgi:hypothetical protein
VLLSVFGLLPVSDLLPPPPTPAVERDFVDGEFFAPPLPETGLSAPPRDDMGLRIPAEPAPVHFRQETLCRHLMLDNCQSWSTTILSPSDPF